MFLKMRKKRAFFLFLFFVIETIDLRKRVGGCGGGEQTVERERGR
jgi:hypothetical protein